MKAQEMNATKKHCKLCFDSLIAALKGQQKPAWPQGLQDGQSPIFITWKKEGDLRGCIGTFSPDRHSKLVPQYALTAALNDSRFTPVKLQQVIKLTAYVSFLVNFEDGKDCYDWQRGKHGIIIKSDYQGGYYSATFLPEVAIEHNMDKQETLKHLIKKAGFMGKLQQIQDSIKLTRYQSSKASLSYQEYLKM